MKKFFKTLTFIVSLLWMGNVSFSQPGNIHYGISGNWNDVTLTDRGVTMAGSLLSPSDDTMLFLFSSSTTNYNPKWCGSNAPNYNRPKNQMLLGNNNGAYHCPDYCGWGVDMECSVLAGNYYTLIVGKNSTANNDMSILETSYNPIDIVSVTQSPASNVSSSESVTVTVTLSGVKNANEHIYVRYTTDSWVTSSCIEITSFVSNQGTAVILPQAANTTVSYYALSSIDDTPNAADIDYLTLRLNNNNNANYSYKVGEITWCNLQSPPSGTCVTGSTYMVYSRVYAQGLTDATSGQAAAGIQAWIGYNTSNTDPSTWTNWVAATYNTDFGNNDEYQANIGSALPAGSYFYASRFQLGSGPYYYGGYEATTGGFWDGSNNISGAFAVIPAPPTITLQTLSAPAGDVSVNIDITGFSMGISAAQWYIYYDPAVLTYSGTSNWAPGFDNSYFVLEISSGVLFFIPGTSTVPYSGTLCQIDFTGYSGASCTDITWETDPTISNIKWDEALFNDYSVNWVNGQVCPCSATSPVWWIGAVNTDWNVSGNWSCNSVPTSTNDVTIPLVTNLPVISNAPAFCRNLTIQAGASVTVSSGNTLSVYGNWLNIGQSNAGSGTVVLAGTNAQTINGTTTFGNLTLNNGNGANLNGNTEVAGVLTLSQGTLITGGFLTLLSTDTQTALIAAGAGSISGDVTMQRYMANKMGYHYYSSPFTAAAVNEFFDEIGPITSGDPYGGTNDTLQTVTPFPNFYAYDETQPYYMQIGWTGAGATMTPMRGYCINFGAAGGAITTDVTGQVNNGSQNYIVTNTTSPYPNADGWNLVGNPYPSPIDWNATSGWNKSNIVNSVYFFNPTTQYTGTYSTYAGGIGVPGNINGIIPAMQGFFVKATVSSGAFSVTNDARISELNPVFHKSIANTTLLRLKGYPAANEPSGDETVIYFDTQATNVFDNDLDAYKWMNNDPAFPNLFTRDDSPSSLAINALPPLTNTDVVIPLGFTTKTGGSFTIKATEILNFDPALHIYLEDNQNSTSQDLTINPDYTFTINANDPLYRFFIRFSPAMVTDIDENGSSFVDAWSSGKDIYVNYSNTAMQNAEISVYNMLGQKVISAAQKGSGTARYRVEEPGCYIINVINGSNTYQKKVVIM